VRRKHATASDEDCIEDSVVGSDSDQLLLFAIRDVNIPRHDTIGFRYKDSLT